MHPDTSMVWRLQNAVDALACGSGNLAARLKLACVANIDCLFDRDFPPDLQDQWRELLGILSKPDAKSTPFSRSESLWAFNIATMSGSKKKRCARIIFDCFTSLVRFKP